MKKILIGLAGLLVVIAVAIFFLVGNLDKIVKGAMEGVGSELMGVPVTVASVEIKLKDGSGQISGMSIANPAGYSSSNAFQMDVIRLGLKISSLGKQPLDINELTIDSPVVSLEVKEDGSSNLQTLLDNMEKNSKKADQKAADSQPETESVPAGEPVHIAFSKLSIKGVAVKVTKEGPDPQNETVTLPDIELTIVGGTEGLTPAELGSLIGGEIITSALQNALEKKITEKVEEAAKGLFGDLKEKLSN